MSNKPLAATPTLSEPTAPDYAVPDAEDAWCRFNRLIDSALATPHETFRSETRRQHVPEKGTGSDVSSELDGAKT